MDSESGIVSEEQFMNEYSVHLCLRSETSEIEKTAIAPLVWRKMASSDSWKASHGTKEKIPKSVGARTQPCFTPLLIGNGSEDDPSYRTVADMHVWKDTIIFRSLGGGGVPILCLG